MRTTLAVLTGYITMVVLVSATDIIIGAVFHGARDTFTVVNMATAFPYAVVGGYVAGVIAQGSEMAAAIGLSALGIVVSVAALSVDRGHQPLWYPAALLVLLTAGALAGGYLRRRQTHKLVG